ncbi:MAG: hypothetical protein AAGB93_13185 [Planctomycetota bacterium]
MNRLTGALLVLVLVAAAALLAWQNRREILDVVAAPESDYTEAFELRDDYGRPGADLSPIWRVPLEPGYGGAAIDGDEIFVLDREIGVGDTLRVLDLATGEPRWSFRYDDPGRLPHAGSRTTPTVTREHVFL